MNTIKQYTILQAQIPQAVLEASELALIFLVYPLLAFQEDYHPYQQPPQSAFYLVYADSVYLELDKSLGSYPPNPYLVSLSAVYPPDQAVHPPLHDH